MALFLTPLFEPLPEATLGAVVVVAVSGMMKVGKMRRLWDLRRVDFWLAMIALVGVLVVQTLVALGAGGHRLAGLLDLADERGSPHVPRPARGRPRARGPVGPSPARSIPGLLIVRPDEMLFFANASSVRDAIVRAAAETQPRPRVVLLDLSLTPEVDVPAVEALESLHRRLAADGIELWLCYVRPRGPRAARTRRRPR